jgi:DNA-binding Lrp family transcriptional regulator
MTDFRRPQPAYRDASTVAILAAIFERPGMTNKMLARMLGANERCVARKTCAMRKLGYISAEGTIPRYSYVPQHEGAPAVPPPPKPKPKPPKEGLTAGQRILLAVAKAGRPIRIGEIADGAAVSKTYCSRLLREYEERGLVKSTLKPAAVMGVDYSLRTMDCVHYEIANKLR